MLKIEDFGNDIFILLTERQLLALEWVSFLKGMSPEDFIKDQIVELLEFYLR
ncbi:MAG: hypothetical protein JW891_00255 [Candidatus Lokiarchaeota archaeon]|nr:hypothetical protein [Candidatus Lokiarchaeota archaeon]